ncbi:MAG: acyl-CoA dehydrogenase family protein [Solirubrobacterales bacterium]|nr:acyl-CoA dehydrogenase family protein [Solirubrobacterales bacterium]MCB8970949.1 acyl-CoA dehydrogenase family protein [Thermoleophilales bacterium]MCO5326155.1 acyl-CoA dehydrogenase family protein [Solirubrobacterales bacterium]
MATAPARSVHATHVVANQSEPLADYNVFDSDRVLVEAVSREGGDFQVDLVREVGALAGRAETIELGRLANENEPKLRTHDRFGNRVDEVEFHPSWHELMSMHVSHGLHALPWREPEPGAHVARAAGFMCLSQAEAGTGCPISMTYSVIPALRAQPEVAAEWEPRFTSLDYDPRIVPSPGKSGALSGMAMTEKQGGSDVRANTTVAVPLNGGGPGAEYEITGHKWFCSAPQCDAFLVLAQTESGVSCFLLPRFTPDGERNRFHIQRLKDKLGNRSNASSEVEFRDAWARMIGEEGRGVATIIEMVNHTRLDCTTGSAAGIRAGTAQAIWHAQHRSAFGKRLVEQPLMQNVLADLAIESEASTTAALWLARQFDEAHAGDERALLVRRIATPVLKYWTCKRAPMHAVECLECFGGNGYAEESGMPRLFRESPLSSIWEGSGNVQALDVLRAMIKSPEATGAFADEVGQAAGAEARLDRFAAALAEDLRDTTELEFRARGLVERMAVALQASLLVRHGDQAVADAFCATRLDGDRGQAFGTLPASVAATAPAIVERAAPAVA